MLAGAAAVDNPYSKLFHWALRRLNTKDTKVKPIQIRSLSFVSIVSLVFIHRFESDCKLSVER